ncbi:hypothetical protein So717_25270 [Roseobacter cerasinus]|uniref:Uncharacterized protein n=1 Tax=Roseobacter cerasinus TaxID=2602289 RepID=A0A640VT48_9RHOB|nr:hypothetical protein So717_25270 [Roseobacter cerasinus]
MMPLIQPLTIPSQPRTEYQKEREAFADMQVELHEYRARVARARFLGRWLRRAVVRLSRWAMRVRRLGRAQ